MTFRVLGIPVSIGLALPFALVVLGLVSGFYGLRLVAWVVFGILAILLHELGHALLFRHYGLSATIQFWLLGGLAVPNDQEAAARLPDRQMLLVALAGPLVGIVLGAVGILVRPAFDGLGHDARVAVNIWVFVNLGWGVFNLLPVGVLDGGRILQSLLMVVLGPGGRRTAIVIGILASLGIAWLAFQNDLFYVGVIALVFGLANPSQYAELAGSTRSGRRPGEGPAAADQTEPAAPLPSPSSPAPAAPGAPNPGGPPNSGASKPSMPDRGSSACADC